MKAIHQKIWELAYPHQDKRDDEGHAEVTLHYAQLLTKKSVKMKYTKQLLAKEDVDADIVIPAIILHDVGWSIVEEETWRKIFDGKATKKEILDAREAHQAHSARLAKNILHSVKYPEEQVKHIIEIVAEHDTRDHFYSKEDGIVRDADKLWRFSKEGIEADLRRFAMTKQELLDKIEKQIDQEGFFYSQTAKAIAREELEKRRKVVNDKSNE